MWFARRPWRLTLSFAVFWLLMIWPLGAAGKWSSVWLLTGFVVAKAGSAFLSMRARAPLVWLGWLSNAVALGLLLLVVPHSPDTLMPALLFTLGTIGVQLSRRWVLVVGVPLCMLALWASEGFRRTTPLEVLLESLGLLAVLLLGHAFASLRRSRDESRALTEQLRAANLALRQQAEQGAELSRLQERERLARDLHDTLGHALSTLTVQLEAARRLQGRDPERAGAQLTDAQVLARQAMQDLRAALDDLRAEPPPSLDALVQDLATPLARQHGWQLNLTVAVPTEALAPQLVLALRPVLAEALVNIARHAGAARVWVTASVQGGWLDLTVEDDGVGLPARPTLQGHYGLRGQRERLTALGGQLELGGRPEGGTRLDVRVPLRVHAASTKEIPA